MNGKEKMVQKECLILIYVFIIFYCVKKDVYRNFIIWIYLFIYFIEAFDNKIYVFSIGKRQEFYG